MVKLNNIVEQLIEQFVGGETYFDKLDETLRDPRNFDIILHLFSTLNCTNVVMSGKFGYHILDLFDRGLIPVKSLVVVNGGLRRGKVTSVEFRNFQEGEKYVFVDDSFYKGRTRLKVAKFLKSINCEMTKTMVVYDGSPVKDEKVFSLYRYHL